MAKRKIFWDTGSGEMYKSWSTMYREDDYIIFHYHDFDREDLRGYDYVGKFSVEDYKRAIEELQKTGSAELKGPNYSLIMSLNGDSVGFRFFGTPSPSRTPGGSSLSGSVSSFCKLKELLIK